MKSIVVSKQGPVSVLECKETAMPELNQNEVLVRLKAAGVNFIDIYMRRGEARIPVTLPFIPGKEGAGIVEKIGSAVTHVKPGDRVAFVSGAGTYAQYANVHEDLLVKIPDEMDFVQGAAFLLQGMTAHYLLHDFYCITPQTNVLVHAAAGGVGLLLVQWLHHMGARVIGTVSTEEKARIAKHAGAHEIILYSQENFAEACKRLTNNIGVDYVIDGVGKTTFTLSLEAVRPCGWVCIYGAASGAAEAIIPNSLQAKSIVLAGGSLFPRINTRQNLLHRAQSVIDAVQAGWLKLNVEHVFPLNEVQRAHELLETRQTTGKIILTIE